MAAIASPTFLPASIALLARDGCPGSAIQCDPSLGAAFRDICCQSGQTCALDAQNSPACCPSGAVCTGAAPTTGGGSPTATARSYVPNSYFSFPYAQTKYANKHDCSAATSTCSNNYQSCMTVLQGQHAHGVTIAVPGGGGTTVDAKVTGLGSSATVICSSLSSKACAPLETIQCKSFGSQSSTVKATEALTVICICLVANFILFSSWATP